MPFGKLLENALQHDGRGSVSWHSATRYEVDRADGITLASEAQGFFARLQWVVRAAAINNRSLAHRFERTEDFRAGLDPLRPRPICEACGAAYDRPSLRQDHQYRVGNSVPRHPAAICVNTDAADAPATRQTYATDLANYKAWCDRHRFVAMPATPEVVGAYLAAAGEGYAMPTLRRRVAAIGPCVWHCRQSPRRPPSTTHVWAKEKIADRPSHPIGQPSLRQVIWPIVEHVAPLA
jgi:hypothetical protein